jgi:hypothetical protein
MRIKPKSLSVIVYFSKRATNAERMTMTNDEHAAPAMMPRPCSTDASLSPPPEHHILSINRRRFLTLSLKLSDYIEHGDDHDFPSIQVPSILL